MDFYEKPNLIEPGVKYFLTETFKQCKTTRDYFYNKVFNLGLFLLFILLFGGLLLYKYKGRLTPLELAQQNKQKQQYILEKIKNFQISKERAQQQLITGLPHWENEYVANMLTSNTVFNAEPVSRYH